MTKPLSGLMQLSAARVVPGPPLGLTERWALLSWRDGTRELYDMVADPEQFTNLAGVAAHAEVLAGLQQRLERKLAAIRR